jgi:CDP-6-deoxy-D-xylo-4-hexulose-3-dehydrase
MAKPIYKHIEKYYPVKYSHIDFVSNFAVPIICKSKAIRDKLVEKCKNKIEIRPIVGGDMTAQPFFRKYMPRFLYVLKNSNAALVHQQGLYFGNNPELTGKEMKEIVNVFTND